MTKKELIFKVIEELGLKGKTDDDGDVVLRYQMKNICIIVGIEEEPFISILFPEFEKVEEGEEMLNLATCNKVTREIKLGKVYIDHTLKSVSASCEFFYTDENSLRNNIEYALRILAVISSTYNIAKTELSE